MTCIHPLSADVADCNAGVFYRRVMDALSSAEIPFLVGGTYALNHFTGIERETKDFDLFVLPEDANRALDALAPSADRTELKYPHWLGKAMFGSRVVDLIFSSGNGLCPIDSEWFDNAPEGRILDYPVRLTPAEELIWQKSFIMERHRFDGSDVIHLLTAQASKLDWERLLRRFDENWPVLLSHLILCRFAYPANRVQELEDVIERLLMKMADQEELTWSLSSGSAQPDCRGTLLSLVDYLPAVTSGEHRDARLGPIGRMSPDEIAYWSTHFEK